MKQIKLLAFLTLILFVATPNLVVFAQADTEYPIYVVQSGDSLSLIALRFGIDLDRLVEVNQITDPNNLSLGTELFIPDFEGVSGYVEFRTVDFGETLFNLSQQYQIPADQIITLNRLTSPNEIVVGTKIIVPQKDIVYPYPISIEPDNSLLGKAIEAGINPWLIMLENDQNDDFMVSKTKGIFSSKESNSSATNLISPYFSEFSVSPLPITQGQTIVVRIVTNQPMKISGTLAGSKLNFFENSPAEYIALQGIHGRQAPGVYEMTLKTEFDGQTASNFYQNILIESGYFSEDPPIVVDPVTIDPAVTEPEMDFVKGLVSYITQQKYWDGNFSYPVDEPCIGAYYGSSRVYNGTLHYYHTGVDFPICTANNLNIYASAPGVVAFAGPLTVRGNAVFLDHGWGIFTAYFHQSEILVSEGDLVDAGQILGLIGSTGRSTGPHLHYEIWVNGNVIDPMPWLQNGYP